jgi:hypothetical protein
LGSWGGTCASCYAVIATGTTIIAAASIITSIAGISITGIFFIFRFFDAEHGNIA